MGYSYMTKDVPKELQKLFASDLKFITDQIAIYYPKFSQRQREKIGKAFWYAAIAHDGQKRFSGEPYFTHPIAATKILLQIKPDIDTVCACLMHDVIEDTEITSKDVEKAFGADIRFLCEGVEKISKVRLKGPEREHESLRKLFVAMAKDIRVIFIKLADRIHNLQTLDHVRPEKRQRIAQESMKIYASVAEKLGLYEFKHQIEDLCFRWLYPDHYTEIEAQAKQSIDAQKNFIRKACKELSKTLKKEGIQYVQVSGRYKNLYSIYEKLKRKNFSHVSEIFDLAGLRIIVKQNSDCYRCLGAIHGHWKPIATRFKDYIAVPKPNGYQSLHTTVLGVAESKVPTEIQIRTEKMHLDAEFGPAAHWAYKRTRSSTFDKNYLEKMSWLPDKIRRDSESSKAEQFFEKISKSLTEDRIHVFTPKGDIKNLVKGATIVDFAYSIHSDLGHTCIAGKINGAIKPLSHELKNGDVVDIVTRTGRGPNPLWLNFAKSPSARGHIRGYLNRHHIKTLSREANPIDERPPKKPKPVKSTPRKTKTRKRELFIGGEKTDNFHLSSCCNPTSKDAIIAYVTRGTRFSIHRANCKMIDRLEPERILDAHFVITNHLKIKATDRAGMMREIFGILERNQQNIIASKLEFDKKQKNKVEWNITVESQSRADFAQVQKELKQVPNIEYVS